MWDKVKKLKIYHSGLFPSGESVRQNFKVFFSLFLPSFLMFGVFFRKSKAAGKTVHCTKEAIELNIWELAKCICSVYSQWCTESVGRHHISYWFLYSFLYVNFSHSLQGLLEIELGFNYGLQFQRRHFWQAEWLKRALHYIFSRKKPPQRGTNAAVSLVWILIPDVQMGRGMLVSESASDWQCLICLHIFFPLWWQWQSQNDYCSRTCNEKLNEGEEKELKKGTGACRSRGDR